MQTADRPPQLFRLPDGRGPLAALWRTALRPLVERAVGLRGLQQLYEGACGDERGGGFWTRVLRHSGMRLHCAGEELRSAVGDQGVVVVANHPFGGPEAIALGALLEEVRPDVRFLANRLLRRVPELEERIFDADVFDERGAVASNAASMREAIRWVRAGHVLVVFPAGEVSHWRRDLGAVADPDWDVSVGGLIRLAHAPVVPVYFEGSNGPAFSAAGMVHPLLRTALLPRALLRRRGRTIRLRVGSPIETDRVNDCPSNAALAAFLRVRTYALADAPADAARRAPGAAVPIADPGPSGAVLAELSALPAERTLAQQGTLRVVLADADEIPNGLLEIGRLREVAFRAVHEGVGRARDLDRFDESYQHLIVWDDRAGRIAGCYRMGATDRILAQRGRSGLYTASLFDIERGLLDELSPALELGRSFVHPDYQKHFAPLMLLWKGIGAYVAQRPQYRYLFGPVSISASYRPNSRQLLTQYLERRHGAPALSASVRPRRPVRTSQKPRWQPGEFDAAFRDVADVDAVLRDLQPDGAGTPVLIRQYLKLNARFLGFSADPSFGDVVDGLVLCDLTQLEPRIAARYLGADGAATFLAHHRLTLEARRPRSPLPPRGNTRAS